ncbi:hypothetical protein [Actinophytocola sediminis]
MPLFKELRGDLVFTANIPPTAADTDIEVPIVELPFDVTVTGVLWVPGAAMTASGTNYVDLNVKNREAGAGTTVVAGPRSWSATNSVANTPEAVTLSATAANLDADEGDLLTAHFTNTASGLAVPAGLVQVTVQVR